MTRRLGPDPDSLTDLEARFAIDRAGVIHDASPRALRWLTRFALVEPCGTSYRLASGWTQRLWQVADDPRPAGVRGLPVRLGLRRALIVRVESIHDEQIWGVLHIVHTRPKIDALWWSILGNGL